MGLEKIKDWYYRIPRGKSEFFRFLSNAHQLGHSKIKRYDATKSAYPIPTEDTGCIPNWVLSNAIFSNESQDDRNAYSTAFWNHAVLVGGGMYEDRVEHKLGNSVLCEYPLSPSISVLDYVLYLDSLSRTLDSKFGHFSETTVGFSHPAESLLHALDGWTATQQKEWLGAVIEHYQNPALRETVEQIVGPEIASVLKEIVNPPPDRQSDDLMDMAARLHALVEQATPPPPPSMGQGEGEDGEDEDGQQQSDDRQPDETAEEDQNTGEDDNEESGEGEDDTEESGEGDDETDQSGDGESNEEPDQTDESDQDSNTDDTESSASPDSVPAELADLKPRDMKLSNRRGSVEMTQAIKDLNDNLEGGWGADESGNDVSLVDISEHDPHRTVEASKHFDNLGTLIKQIKVNKPAPIDPYWYGDDILEDELYRVRVDGKVFGTDDYQPEPPKKEWVIGIDLSGSMSDGSLYLRALQAAKGAFNSLREANETVTIYGHNSSWDTCCIYPITHTRDPLSNLNFNKATGIYRTANFDYDFLDWVSEHGFIHQDSLKIIIMLSDGQPCPVGNEGIRLMKDAVRRARIHDRIVISASLVWGVIAKNDRIYGKEWNIDATSVHGIDEALYNLIIKYTLGEQM